MVRCSSLELGLASELLLDVLAPTDIPTSDTKARGVVTATRGTPRMSRDFVMESRDRKTLGLLVDVGW